MSNKHPAKALEIFVPSKNRGRILSRAVNHNT